MIGLPEGRARNHNRPQQIPVLAGVVIEDVAVGAEHTLALASTGDVYAWGSNSEGQVNVMLAALSCLRNLTLLLIGIPLYFITIVQENPSFVQEVLSSPVVPGVNAGMEMKRI